MLLLRILVEYRMRRVQYFNHKSLSDAFVYLARLNIGSFLALPAFWIVGTREFHVIVY